MSWCEIQVRPTPHPTLRPGRLTLEVSESNFHEPFVRCLRQLPWEDRGFDPDTKHWWVAARHRDAVCAEALTSYDEVYVIEGARTLNVRTGQISQQLSMFEEP